MFGSSQRTRLTLEHFIFASCGIWLEGLSKSSAEHHQCLVKHCGHHVKNQLCCMVSSAPDSSSLDDSERHSNFKHWGLSPRINVTPCCKTTWVAPAIIRFVIVHQKVSSNNRISGSDLLHMPRNSMHIGQRSSAQINARGHPKPWGILFAFACASYKLLLSTHIPRPSNLKVLDKITPYITNQGYSICL